MVMKILYKGGYKYQLQNNYLHWHRLSISPPEDIITEYIELDTRGVLTIKRGYAWDGPSGPTFDTKTFMRGSLVHDALYQLMRMGLFDAAAYRDVADRELRRICLEDKMWRIRAWWVYKGVKHFARSAATKQSARKVIIAP